jgi:hypothetical protein
MAARPDDSVDGVSRATKLVFALSLLWPLVLVDVSGPPMTDSVLLAAMRLAEHGTFTLSDHDDPEVVSRTAAFDISSYGGRVYSGLAPGASVLAAPVYALLGPVFQRFDHDVVKNRRVLEYYAPNRSALGLPPSPHWRDGYLLQIALVWLVVAPLFALFVARLFALLCRRGLTPGHALVVCASCGIGSLTLYYGCMYSRQALAYLLLWNAALFLVERPPRALGPMRASVVVLAAGVAMTVDYPSALLVAVTAVFTLPRLSWKERAAVALPIAGCLGALALYHDAAFGSPLATAYHHRFWMTTAQMQQQGLDPKSFERGAFVGMNLPSLRVAAELTFGLYKGLFVYSPVLLLGLIGHLRGLAASNRAPEHAYCLALVVVYVTFNSTMGTHLPHDYGRLIWGGLSMLWGPRHLLGIVPFLALGLAALPMRSRPVQLATAVALVASIAINVAGCLGKQALMAEPALSTSLRRPIAFVLGELFETGPRVTLLDAYGAPAGLQLAVLAALLGASILLLRSAAARSTQLDAP